MKFLQKNSPNRKVKRNCCEVSVRCSQTDDDTCMRDNGRGQTLCQDSLLSARAVQQHAVVLETFGSCAHRYVTAIRCYTNKINGDKWTVLQHVCNFFRKYASIEKHFEFSFYDVCMAFKLKFQYSCSIPIYPRYFVGIVCYYYSP